MDAIYIKENRENRVNTEIDDAKLRNRRERRERKKKEKGERIEKAINMIRERRIQMDKKRTLRRSEGLDEMTDEEAEAKRQEYYKFFEKLNKLPIRYDPLMIDENGNVIKQERAVDDIILEHLIFERWEKIISLMEGNEFIVLKEATKLGDVSILNRVLELVCNIDFIKQEKNQFAKNAKEFRNFISLIIGGFRKIRDGSGVVNEGRVNEDEKNQSDESDERERKGEINLLTYANNTDMKLRLLELGLWNDSIREDKDIIDTFSKGYWKSGYNSNEKLKIWLSEIGIETIKINTLINASI